MARIIVEQVICRLRVPMAMLTDCRKEVDGQLMSEIRRFKHKKKYFEMLTIHIKKTVDQGLYYIVC